MGIENNQNNQESFLELSNFKLCLSVTSLPCNGNAEGLRYVADQVENYSNLINTGTTCPEVKRPQVFGLGEKAAKERPAQEHDHQKIEKQQ